MFLYWSNEPGAVDWKSYGCQCFSSLNILHSGCEEDPESNYVQLKEDVRLKMVKYSKLHGVIKHGVTRAKDLINRNLQLEVS
jgi:hypothetical protein